jgi:hypothetical protein
VSGSSRPVVYIVEIINTYRILVREFEERDHFRDLSADSRMRVQ